MEKLQVILGYARKHHFWLLCIVVVVLALVGWTQASSHLSSAYTEQVRIVKENFDKVQRVSGVENPPNDRWKSEVDKMVIDMRDKVYDLWKQEHAQQKEKILRWPTELGESFLEFVRNNGPNEVIPRHLCQIYWNYVRDEFPKLREIIKAQDPDAERESGAGNVGFGSRFNVGVGAAPDRRRTAEGVEGGPLRKEKPFIVNWDAADQQRIKADLDIDEPSSKQVRDLQEDLWVYRALLRVIANVNESATGQFNAKIRRLDRMAIGIVATDEFKAGNASGQIYVPPRPEGAAAAAAVEGAVYGETPAAGADMGLSAEQSPDAGRYVDAQGQPLPTQAEQAELKRMPVYLKLVMDQRYIHRLLAECANSPLPIEVRQLRIKSLQSVPGGGVLFDTAASSTPVRRGGAFGGGGGGSRFSVGGGSRFSVGGGGGGVRRTPTVPSGSSGTEENPNDVEVELHGIICIYNPPDKDKLEIVAANVVQEERAVPAESPPATNGPAAGTQAPEGQPAVNPMNPVPASSETATAPAPAAAPAVPMEQAPVAPEDQSR